MNSPTYISRRTHARTHTNQHDVFAHSKRKHTKRISIHTCISTSIHQIYLYFLSSTPTHSHTNTRYTGTHTHTNVHKYQVELSWGPDEAGKSHNLLHHLCRTSYGLPFFPRQTPQSCMCAGGCARHDGLCVCRETLL